LREAYLPEIILAYDTILHFAGLYISRDNFLEALNLATMIASEGADFVELFLKTGKMKDLVESLAGDSAALLFSTGPGKQNRKPTKKIKERGWLRDIWRIRAQRV
jgi:nuclear pore complex protein Nup107